MSEQAPAAFFSYSRSDSDFAQKLAKSLRAAGATIWLDQFDINPGQRWDRAVEEALAGCRRLLVILSPSSVESTNVMDEVSFALEEGKIVIPVLYRDCKIPFRLRRVQYIDFRGDYDSGITELLKTLSPGERVPDPAQAQAAEQAALEAERAELAKLEAERAALEAERAQLAKLEAERAGPQAERAELAKPQTEQSETARREEPAGKATSVRRLAGWPAWTAAAALGAALVLFFVQLGFRPKDTTQKETPLLQASNQAAVDPGPVVPAAVATGQQHRAELIAPAGQAGGEPPAPAQSEAGPASAPGSASGSVITEPAAQQQASQPAAGSSPAIAPSEVQDIWQAVTTAAANRDPIAFVASYGDRVRYFAAGSVGRDFILRDKKAFFHNWFKISYSLAGDVTMSPESDGSVLVHLPVRFDVENAQKNKRIQGLSDWTWRLRRIDGRAQIVEESEAVRGRDRSGAS